MITKFGVHDEALWCGCDFGCKTTRSQNRTPPSLSLSVWPHLFRGAGHEKRRGEQLKWPLAFRLYIGSFLCAQLPVPVHTARLGRVFFFGVFSLGFCFVCSFVLFDLFVCHHSFMFSWAIESSPLQMLALV